MAVNASILVGYRLAGIPGTLVTVLGTILPPLIILSIISIGYTAFRDSVAAVSYTHLDVYKRQVLEPEDALEPRISACVSLLWEKTDQGNAL